MKVAIVGGGISGLMAALELREQGIDFTLFEANDYVGGHVKTLKIAQPGGAVIPIELGTMMHDPKLMHPVLNQYARKFRVEIAEFPVTFTHFDKMRNFSWSTQTAFTGYLRKLAIGLKVLGKGALKGSFLKHSSFIFELNRFLSQLETIAKQSRYAHMSVAEYFAEEHFSASLRDEWLVPQFICWWGASREEAMASSIQVFADSVYQVNDTTQYMFKDGWSVFTDRVAEKFRQNIRLNSTVTNIKREDSHVLVGSHHGTERFDYLLLAVPPRISLSILKDITFDEKEVLSAFKTTVTKVYLHTDAHWLPSKEKWSIVNTIHDEKGDYCTYWAGGVFPGKPRLFLTWGDGLRTTPDPDKTLQTNEWLRTLPTVAYTYACRDMLKLQGENRTWHCGAHVHALGEDPPSLWHENALKSGIQAAHAISKARRYIGEMV